MEEGKQKASLKSTGEGSPAASKKKAKRAKKPSPSSLSSPDKDESSPEQHVSKGGKRKRTTDKEKMELMALLPPDCIIRQRAENALKSKEKRARRKAFIQELEADYSDVFNENKALKSQNKKLESKLAEAQRIVSVLEEHGGGGKAARRSSSHSEGVAAANPFGSSASSPGGLSVSQQLAAAARLEAANSNMLANNNQMSVGQASLLNQLNVEEQLRAQQLSASLGSGVIPLNAGLASQLQQQLGQSILQPQYPLHHQSNPGLVGGNPMEYPTAGSYNQPALQANLFPEMQLPNQHLTSMSTSLRGANVNQFSGVNIGGDANLYAHDQLAAQAAAELQRRNNNAAAQAQFEAQYASVGPNPTLRQQLNFQLQQEQQQGLGHTQLPRDSFRGNIGGNDPSSPQSTEQNTPNWFDPRSHNYPQPPPYL